VFVYSAGRATTLIRSDGFSYYVYLPSWFLFHDTTLRELARHRPATIEALRHIYGVGARKADDLGEAVLAVIRDHASPELRQSR